MAARMKTTADPADSTEPRGLNALPVVGRVIITCHDTGDGHFIPGISFEPVGKISQGWFERHQHHFLRAIQRAQVAQRRGDEP